MFRSLLTTDTVRVDFILDKAIPPGDKDARELGIVVARVRSGAQMNPSRKVVWWLLDTSVAVVPADLFGAVLRHGSGRMIRVARPDPSPPYVSGLTGDAISAGAQGRFRPWSERDSSWRASASLVSTYCRFVS